MQRVAIVGSANVDLTVVAPREVRPGETITGTAFLQGLGGKGANQAAAAARAGAPTSFVGCVGADAFGALVGERLRSFGVALDHLVIAEGAQTGIAHIRVAEGDNSIVVVPLANALVTSEHVRVALPALGGSGVLLTQLEIDPAVTFAALEQAHEAGWTTILDPAPALPLPEALWQHVDLVKPNEHEAEILTGIPVTDAASAERAAGWFRDRGVSTVIVTLGARGALVMDADGTRSFEAERVQPVDSTAAGDTFSGFLAASLAAGEGIDAAVRRAMRAAAISVTRLGASESIPAAAEVDRAH